MQQQFGAMYPPNPMHSYHAPDKIKYPFKYVPDNELSDAKLVDQASQYHPFSSQIHRGPPQMRTAGEMMYYIRHHSCMGPHINLKIQNHNKYHPKTKIKDSTITKKYIPDADSLDNIYDFKYIYILHILSELERLWSVGCPASVLTGIIFDIMRLRTGANQLLLTLNELISDHSFVNYKQIQTWINTRVKSMNDAKMVLMSNTKRWSNNGYYQNGSNTKNTYKPPYHKKNNGKNTHKNNGSYYHKDKPDDKHTGYKPRGRGKPNKKYY